MNSTIPSGSEFISTVHVGVPKEFTCDGMSPEVNECWQNTVDLLKSKGARVSEVCGKIDD